MNIRTRKPPGQRGRPDDGAEALERATQMLVAGGRQHGQDDAMIRDLVTSAFRQAVAGEGPWKAMHEVDARGPVEMVTSAGIFRMALEHLGIDRRQAGQMEQETWWSVVERAMVEMLKLDEGDSGGGRRADGAGGVFGSWTQ